MGVGSGSALIPPPAYTGPGDIVSFTYWGGMRAYSAAVAATGTQKSINVRRASDNATQDILILTSGALDTASALTFAGTDVTGNATSSGTTVALTGLASTAHVGDTITGTGYIGTYIISIGSLVAGAQTVTTNTSQTIGVSAPVTLTWGLYVTTLYGQVGAVDLVQVTAANQPQLILNGGPTSSLPILVFAGNQWLAATFSSGAAPYSATCVHLFTSTASSAELINTYTGAGGVFEINSLNQEYIYSGNIGPLTTIAAATWYAAQAVFNGASSSLVLNGTTNTGNVGSGASGTTLNLGALAADNSRPLIGKIAEAGWKSGGAFTAGNITSLTSNQRTYWGF